MLDFLLVIPARNEEQYIKGILIKADETLKDLVKNYKIIVIDASSTDDTVRIVEGIAKTNKRIDIIRDRERGAKGADIMYAFSKYNSKLYGFIDSDIVSAIGSLEEMLRQKDYYDVIIGSRYMGLETPGRPMIRLYISRTYNKLLSLIFDDGVKDHQCGFKLFDKKAVELIRKYSLERHWPWDTEVLLICKYGGMRICEMKVDWKEVRARGNEANITRAISDIYLFIIPMIRMFYRFKIEKVVK